MNPLYLAQTNIQVTNDTPRGLLANNGRNVRVILLNGGKSFITANEYDEQGRNCKIYLTADFQGKDKKNLVHWPKTKAAEK